MNEIILALLAWVCLNMGVDPKTIEPPKVEAISPQQMSMIVCGEVDARCPIGPAIFDGEILYYVEGVDFKSKRMASVVVHHLVHYVQLVKKEGGDIQKFVRKINEYEKDAVRLQELYLSTTAM